MKYHDPTELELAIVAGGILAEASDRRLADEIRKATGRRVSRTTMSKWRTKAYPMALRMAREINGRARRG